MMHKKAHEAGADQRTPSVPQYFSWINNTNEGSTEAQTMINLDFFAWLKRVYGMEIKIYAWDAGNFDGAGMGYGDPEGEKFRGQYPRGYAPVVERAAEIGIRMGLWGSPDGFGDTPEEERKRYDFMVDLCRKYHFALFKVDGVCGTLRPEKATVYANQLRECREAAPQCIQRLAAGHIQLCECRVAAIQVRQLRAAGYIQRRECRAVVARQVIQLRAAGHIQ